MSTFQPVRLDGSTTNVVNVTSGTTLKGEVPGAFQMDGLLVQVAFAETPIGNYYDLSFGYELMIIPDLYVDFKPLFATSKIYLTAMINCNAPHVSSFGFFRDGVNLSAEFLPQLPMPAAVTASDVQGTANYSPGGWASQYANNNVVGSMHTTYPGADTTDYMWNFLMQSIDQETGTNARRRYQVGAAASWGDGRQSMRINDRGSGDMRSVTNLCVMEFV